MALRDYLAGEVGVDWADGLITRREALRRLALLGLSAPAASAILAACSSEGGEVSGPTTAPSTTATGSATATGSTPSSATATPSTTAASSTTGSTAASAGGAAVAPAPITFAGPSGELRGSFAAAATPKGAVLLIHENRGLTDHFVALPGRFAASGYSALAIDLLSAEGGTAAFADSAQATAALGAASQSRLTADVRAGLEELARRTPGKKLAVVGFCFGGGQVWQLLAAGTDDRVAAAVPFYGPGPAGADFSKTRAAVLGVYAERDSRVNASREAMGAALAAAGRTSELKTFPGVDHAFFNDTGARYDATQAGAAYDAVLAWFATHLA